MMRRVPFLCASLLLLSLLACSDPPAHDSVGSEYLNLGPDAEYVGIDVCKTCHIAQYETYIESEMGRSFRPATLTNSAADFSNPVPVYDPTIDLYYQPFHRGEALFVREFRVSGGDTVHNRVEQIDYIVGSGQHTNSHIMEENGYLYQMPVTWYAQDGRWDLAPRFAGGNNSRFERPIPLQCMACHNATPTFVPRSENRYTYVPHGIDCERCHGPGSVHVEAIRAGRVVDVTTAIDYTIVNPRKLPVDLQFDICQNCHMQGVSVYKPGKDPLDFRPGLRLTDIQNVFWPRYSDSARSFIMASHPDRLKMSACFQASHAEPGPGGAMTCITCHDPHVSIKTMGAEPFNTACGSCHTPEQANLCTGPEDDRADLGDNCISCHMPVSGTTDIPHVRVTDHFIRPPQPDAPPPAGPGIDESRQMLGLVSLVEAQPPVRDVADAYLIYYEEVTDNPAFLDSALVYLQRAEREVPRDELASSWIRAWFWKQDFSSIIRLARTLDAAALDDPWTLYRIGEALLSSGQPREAASYLEQAVARAPDHLRFLNKLALAYRGDDRVDESLAVYNRVLAVNPKFEVAYNNRGFARLVQGDLEGGEEDFLTAIALFPDAVSPLGNLASLYFNTGRKAEARPYVRRLLELDPDNPDYRQIWQLLQE